MKANSFRFSEVSEPHRVRTFKRSNDPAFAEKVEDVVGLYMHPPAHAVVLSIDEKSQIQALDRTQPGLPIKPGRCGTMSHDYKRHGTSTLFAALDVANGEVIARHYKRRRRIEFLDFMNAIVVPHPEREIHVILDNLSTHKPKRDRWLAAHPNVHFHFTPTYASWLNQIECWFSILSGQSLKGASFTGVAQLRAHIDAFVARYNQTARPFAWTKSEVHQKRLKPRFADL